MTTTSETTGTAGKGKPAGGQGETSLETPEEATFGQRDAYREKRKAQIEELAARLDLWEAKAKKASAEARIRYREELEDLRGRLDTARMKLSLLKDAGEDAWDELRTGADAAVKDLRRAFRRASSKFR